MLIVTRRHTRADLDAWEMYRRADALNARRLGRRLDEAEEKAMQVMRDFIAAGGGHLSISWGKDSVVVAYMLHRLQAEEGIEYPSGWVRVKDWENPDCVLARDAFLDRYPLHGYEEVVVDTHKGGGVVKGRLVPGFKELARRHGDRHITGIRGAESKVRRMVMGRWGTASDRACRPIGWWPTEWVFAFIESRQIPLHPAYGYLGGGMWDRRHLRVATLGGSRGGGHGRAGWEARYYPDVMSRCAQNATRSRDVGFEPLELEASDDVAPDLPPPRVE